MMKRVNARARLSFSCGFTMVELLLVIVVIGLLGMAVLPVFLDFRYEARIAAAQNYINGLVSAITSKKAQIMLRCNQGPTIWPRLEAIQMNDVTEGGNSSAHCTLQQIPNPQDRK